MTTTVITLLKRRAGMSKAEFIAYYEARHRVIGEQVLAGHATRYVRRYLHPLDGEDQLHDADVVLEIDFPDRAGMEAFYAAIAADPATAAMIAEDEERLFDRSRIRTFTVEEHASTV